jgi:hypothetical protein
MAVLMGQSSVSVFSSIAMFDYHGVISTTWREQNYDRKKTGFQSEECVPHHTHYVHPGAFTILRMDTSISESKHGKPS